MNFVCPYFFMRITVFVFRNRIKGGVAAFHRNIKGVISPTTQIPDHIWKKSLKGKF